MALRMGGVFIQAQVGNDAGTFDIGSSNAFAGSINGISLTMFQGGASTIEVNLTPTFTQAVQIIESGFLGFGFPLSNRSAQSTLSNIIGGIIRRSAQPVITSSKSSSLAVRFGYGDLDANESRAKTPWIAGIITAPDISFGEEISITLKATSMGVQLTSSDTTRLFQGETLFQVVNTIIQEDINGTVVFDPQAQARASEIRVFDNQTDNSYAFIKKLLEEYNFKFYESGGTGKTPLQEFRVENLAGISNQQAQFQLVMYGQIDVPNRVYPIESFETNITHKIVSSGFHGAKVTNLKTSNKEVDRNEEFGIDTYKKDIKSKGNTIGGKKEEGQATRGGVTDGPPTLNDDSLAGKRYVTVQKNDDDLRDKESAKSQTHDDMDDALIVNLTCPLIPEAIPNKMVRVTIYTGDPNNPVFKTISGLYKIHEVRHSVGDSGGSTELTIMRGIGASTAESEGVQLAQDIKTALGQSVAIPAQLSVFGGLLS